MKIVNELIDIQGLDNLTKLRLIFTQLMLVIVLPMIIIMEFDNPLCRIILCLLWVGTIDDTSPFIQKHFTNKLLGINTNTNTNE